MTEQHVFIILGAGGFPYNQSAASNKYFLLAKALLIKDFEPLLLSRPNYNIDVLQKTGEFENVRFCFLAGKKKKKSIISRVFAELIVNLTLIVQLQRIRSLNDKNFLMISFSSYLQILYYWILSRLFGYKLLFSVMEYHLATAKTKTEKKKAKIFWKYSFRYADGSIPISYFLEKEIHKRHKNLPTYKIPAIADFKTISSTKRKISKTKFFLYCGSAGYNDVIDLIVQAFLRLNEKDVDLYLVLSGKEKLITKYRKLSISHQNISIFTKLTYQKLTDLYQQSIGLLIPLRPNIQDEARFPQKVPEYLASGSPIISNSVGEMKYYFSDGINIIFAKDYSEESIREAMHFVFNNPVIAEEIGINGQQFGFRKFHYEGISDEFANFLYSL